MFTLEANFAFTESLNAFGFNGQKTAEDIFRFESQFLVKKNAFRFTHAPEPGVFFAEVSQIWWRVRKLFFEAIKLAAKDEVLIQKTEQQSCTREETRRSFFYILFGTLQLLFPATALCQWELHVQDPSLQKGYCWVLLHALHADHRV